MANESQLCQWSTNGYYIERMPFHKTASKIYYQTKQIIMQLFKLFNLKPL